MPPPQRLHRRAPCGAACACGSLGRSLSTAGARRRLRSMHRSNKSTHRSSAIATFRMRRKAELDVCGGSWAADEPQETESRCREWRADYFVAAIKR